MFKRPFTTPSVSAKALPTLEQVNFKTLPKYHEIPVFCIQQKPE